MSVQNGSSFNTLATLKESIDTESSVSINDEIKYQNHISKDISDRQNSA